MNSAHLHLIRTHFPPVLSVGGAVSAAGGVLRRRRDLLRIALMLLIGVGAMMPLVYIAGNRAADSIGRVEGVQQDAIAPHQHAATIALASSMATALIAGGLLIIDRRSGSLSPALRLLVLGAAIASALAIGWAAALGGGHHHPAVQS